MPDKGFRNVSVRLRASEADMLDELAESMGSTSQVIRLALRELRKSRGDHQADALRFVDELRSRFAPDAVLRVELDDGFDPFAKVDGERQDDIYLAHRVGTFEDNEGGARTQYVIVYIGDPESDVRIQLGMLPLQAGVPLNVPLAELEPEMRPRPVAYFPAGE